MEEKEEQKVCKTCFRNMGIKGQISCGFEYTFVCRKCEELVMTIESYEEEIS